MGASCGLVQQEPTVDYNGVDLYFYLTVHRQHTRHDIHMQAAASHTTVKFFGRSLWIAVPGKAVTDSQAQGWNSRQISPVKKKNAWEYSGCVHGASVCLSQGRQCRSQWTTQQMQYALHLGTGQ